MKKRIISLMLALIMVLGMIPMVAAEEAAPALEPIVLDFQQFAQEAAQQDFWDELIPTTNVADARMLGALTHGVHNTDEQKAAVAALETWMEGRYNWDIPNLTDAYKAGGHFNHPYAGDQLFIDPTSSLIGIRYYTHFPNNGGGESRLELTVTVPEGAAGEYIIAFFA